jgi:hypothetical protein
MFADSNCRLFCDRVPLWVSADRREGHFAVPVFSLEQSVADIVAPKFVFVAVRYVKFQDRRLPVSWCTNPGSPDSHDRRHLGSSLESLDYNCNTAGQFMGRFKPLCACGELLLVVESLVGGGLGEQVLLQGFQKSTLVSLKHVPGLHAMQAVSNLFSVFHARAAPWQHARAGPWQTGDLRLESLACPSSARLAQATRRTAPTRKRRRISTKASKRPGLL